MGFIVTVYTIKQSHENVLIMYSIISNTQYNFNSSKIEGRCKHRFRTWISNYIHIKTETQLDIDASA